MGDGATMDGGGELGTASGMGVVGWGAAMRGGWGGGPLVGAAREGRAAASRTRFVSLSSFTAIPAARLRLALLS